MTGLRTERQGAVVVLVLDRPQRLNAFDAGLHAALLAALAAAAADPTCRALLLRGEGLAFCAGQDLAEPGLTDADVDLRAVLERGWNPLVLALRSLPKPVVCAVHGTAAGAGAAIALACDFVVAAEDARFIQAFIRIGLAPDSGATWTLPRLVGPARARALAMLGDPVTGAAAAAMGMIHRAVPAADLLAEAEALAQRLARLPAQALAETKRLLEAGATSDLPTALAAEAAAQQPLGRGADYAEGVSAFQARRPAKFSGAPE